MRRDDAGADAAAECRTTWVVVAIMSLPTIQEDPRRKSSDQREKSFLRWH